MTITLEQLEAQHGELAKLIESFKDSLQRKVTVSAAVIELAKGEHYAGLVLDEHGKPTHHLVLLPGDAEDLTWSQAKEWAAAQGGELPTRSEQSLLFANLKREFQDAWYWSGQQHETNSSWAWFQNFSHGGSQSRLRTSDAFRARAVRRLVIE